MAVSHIFVLFNIFFFDIFLSFPCCFSVLQYDYERKIDGITYSMRDEYMCFKCVFVLRFEIMSRSHDTLTN